MGTGMGVEDWVLVSPGLTCFLLPEPKPFCVRPCVPSLPLSPVPRLLGSGLNKSTGLQSSLETWDGKGQGMGACSVHQRHAYCL